jgi:hypothetical protein
MKEDKATIEAIVAEVMRAEHGSACAGIRRRIAWRRRVMFVGATIFATWAMGEFIHIEAMHEGVKIGLDGLVACLIEKACFGME